MSKVIVITGGSRGIGAETARRAASAGFDVCILYKGNTVAAEKVAEDVRALGRKCVAFQGSNNDEAAVKAMFDQAEAELGPVTALVNNAGIPGRITRVEDLDMEVLREVLEINVVGSFICAREAVRRMSTKHGGQGGAIVNLSSMGATTGSPGELVHYAAAKGAIESFTRGLAREVAQEGIRVNSVSPGLIETEIHAEAGDGERLARYATRMPMARAGKPGEIADAVLWMLSDQSSYVTAVVLPVAGGR